MTTCTQAACIHPRELLATDSIGHEIWAPCHPCLLNWRQHHQEKVPPQVTVCDECNGGLEVTKQGLRCLRCGQEYK